MLTITILFDSMKLKPRRRLHDPYMLKIFSFFFVFFQDNQVVWKNINKDKNIIVICGFVTEFEKSNYETPKPSIYR